ncbi:hypothetical protein BgiBS90_028108 [Biomphalaria glabrata]|nr:hypothetical protein BgiBS90_028108 [Biomphalaria glabrata]
MLQVLQALMVLSITFFLYSSVFLDLSIGSPKNILVTIREIANHPAYSQLNMGMKLYFLRFEKKKNWVVLDDVSTPCMDVTLITKQEDWSVAIFVDVKKDIIGCSPPKCYQITRDYLQQSSSHFSTLTFINTSSKLTGYLFAIENGAKVILDTECDALVENITGTFHINDAHQSGLMYEGAGLFNPFHHFGLTEAFPKEFWAIGRINTTRNISELRNSDIYSIVDWSSVSIRQGVTVSTSTCLKYTQGNVSRPTVVNTTPVFIRNSTAASFSTGPTVFFEDVFKLLFFPPELNLEEKKAFRTRLLNEMIKGSQLLTSFYYVSTHNQPYDCAYVAEAGKQSLNTSCVSSSNCTDMSSCNPNDECCNDILKNVTICIMKACLQLKDLTNIKVLISSWIDDLTKFTPKKLLHPRTITKTVYRIPKQLKMFKNITSDLEKIVSKDIVSLCGLNVTINLHAIQKMTNPVIHDILLIIVINYDSLFPSLGFNEFLHRQYFKFIVYCVPSVEAFQTYTDKEGFQYVTFIEGVAHGWEFFYECTAGAMKLGLPVQGYLQIGDDVLLNTWNIVALPRTEMSIFSKMDFKELYKKDPKSEWVHWNSYRGQSAVEKVIGELKNALNLSVEEQLEKYPRVNFTTFAERFLKNLEGNLKPNFVIYGATDIFYVPQILQNEYITITEIFRKHNCMVELVVGNIYMGLKNPFEEKYLFEGHGLWNNDRQKPWMFFDARNETFIHPFKWLYNTNNEEGRTFACERYLPLLS